jgi:hypothetical protein
MYVGGIGQGGAEGVESGGDEFGSGGHRNVDSGRKPGDAFDESSASGVVDPDGEASVRV